MEQLIPIGVIVVLIGFALIIVGGISTALKSKVKTEGGFVVFIGPFPIIGATSKTMFYTVVVLTIIFLVVFLFLNKHLI